MVVGAGVGGMYSLYRLREMGHSARVFDGAGGDSRRASERRRTGDQGRRDGNKLERENHRALASASTSPVKRACSVAKTERSNDEQDQEAESEKIVGRRFRNRDRDRPGVATAIPV